MIINRYTTFTPRHACRRPRHAIAMCLLLLGIGHAMAQKPNIFFKGQTVNAAGKTITLYRYSDPLSRNEVRLDEDEIGDNGAFGLEAYANYPMEVVVEIENYSQTFVAEPGRTYEMYLDEFDWNLDEKRNINLAPVALPFQFQNLPDNELNLSIMRFDQVVDSFIYENRIFFDFKYRPDRTHFDTLLMEVRQKCPDTDNEYFNRYKKYHLAALQYELGNVSRKRLFEQMIQEQPIRYYDDSYMHLFLTLFQKSVSKGNRYLTQKQVAEMVEHGAVANLLDSLGLDPLLRNEQVRELVALQALGEAYYWSYYYKPDKVLQMIEKIGAQSKFDDHRRLSANLLQKLRQENAATVLPDFTLPDAEKHMMSLSQFKGKWVYLSFVRVGEPASLSEIETLAHFYDSVCGKYDSVVFVTIDCDREFQKMYHMLKNNKRGNRYRWTWLHFDGNYKLLERYQVASYPTFILLNPEGKRQYSVTPAPATGFLARGPWVKKEEEQQKEFILNGQ